MKLLKTITLKWWQIPIVKISLLALGIIIGMYLKDYLIDWINVFWILFVVSAIYLIVDWWRQ